MAEQQQSGCRVQVSSIQQQQDFASANHTQKVSLKAFECLSEAVMDSTSTTSHRGVISKHQNAGYRPCSQGASKLC
jgi:hypothetical protein